MTVITIFMQFLLICVAIAWSVGSPKHFTMFGIAVMMGASFINGAMYVTLDTARRFKEQ